MGLIDEGPDTNCKTDSNLSCYLTVIFFPDIIGNIHPGLTIAALFTAWWAFCFVMCNGEKFPVK